MSTVTSNRPPTAASAAKIGLGQPLVRNQRIAESGVREQLAGGDLMVGDDPVAEPDMPPDVRVAQRIEPDSTGEDEDRAEQRPAWVREPRDDAVCAGGVA